MTTKKCVELVEIITKKCDNIPARMELCLKEKSMIS